MRKEPEAIFNGIPIFIGDVGRPDLARKLIAELTQDILAGHLYDSFAIKINAIWPDT